MTSPLPRHHHVLNRFTGLTLGLVALIIVASTVLALIPEFSDLEIRRGTVVETIRESWVDWGIYPGRRRHLPAQVPLPRPPRRQLIRAGLRLLPEPPADGRRHVLVVGPVLFR